jgi:hypothetical protein
VGPIRTPRKLDILYTTVECNIKCLIYCKRVAIKQKQTLFGKISNLIDFFPVKTLDLYLKHFLIVKGRYLLLNDLKKFEFGGMHLMEQ